MQDDGWCYNVQYNTQYNMQYNPQYNAKYNAYLGSATTTGSTSPNVFITRVLCRLIVFKAYTVPT